MEKVKLSVVLATLNEKENIGLCLESVKRIADEIIVVDEGSTDKTRVIAKKYGAKVYKVKHEPIFHKTKQKAIDKATGDWILQLDADERVTPELAKEIIEVVNSSNDKLLERVLVRNKMINHQSLTINHLNLFVRHQKLIEQRTRPQSRLRRGDDVVAFFVPRRNYFLGKPLIHAGVYPDGVIRLFRKGKARLPGKSVHELMEVNGEVAWLFNDLEHHESPTLNRYLGRANRYTDLKAEQFKSKKVSLSYFVLFYYSFIKPFMVFLNLYLRHKGFLDGMRGFIWSLFSALNFTLTYFKYWQSSKKD